MGPTLLCDKSAIQTLNRASPVLLHHYFRIIIPPILVTEILGDLAKETNGSTVQSVKMLANKVASISAFPNVDFRLLFSSELDGKSVSMNRCPVVAVGNSIEARTGEIGLELADDPNEQALDRWRRGDFSVDEHLMSKVWRYQKDKLDWRTLIKMLDGIYSSNLKKKTNFRDVLEFVDDLMASNPEFLANWFCRSFQINKKATYDQCAHALNTSSYSSFCVRITLFALWSMHFGLVTPKADNQLDLEYLFYLPFAKTFVTHDKFQKAIAPHFLKEDQTMVDFTRLAKDLLRLSTWLASLEEEAKSKELQRDGPPENPDSICHEMWVKYMGSEYRNREQLARSQEMDRKIRDRFQQFLTGKRSDDSTSWPPVESASFIIKKQTLLVTDPCPCRSGKAYKDCHGIAMT